MALDESNANDTTLDVDGFTFCIEKELLDTISGATIDISYMGFVIEPTNPLPVQGGASGASCSTCSSGSCG